VLRVLHVARPDDWTGVVATALAGVVTFLGLVAAALARLPPAIADLDLPWQLATRFSFALVALWLVGTLRRFLYSRLPRAPFLLFDRLVLPARPRRRRVKLAQVHQVYLERRPAPDHEVVIVALRDGTRHDVCPITWRGAASLFRALRRKIR
jgi:hypothetical protein